ncbi:MAG: alpha-2-macroglobulin, partial [Lentisphaeria bacterium]
FVHYDDENHTAFVRNEQNLWWCWYSNNIETNATYLKLLTKINPHDKITAGLVKFLLNNRSNANYWHSTRDTALCIEAFAQFIKASNENAPNQNVQILLNDKLIKQISFTPENIFFSENSITIPAEKLSSGLHQISIKKSGQGPLYANAYLQFFSQEKFIEKDGLELKINRNFYKISTQNVTINVPNSHGIITPQLTQKMLRSKILPNHAIKTGDIIEVELIIESKNDYEFISIDDFKAAGFEPLQNQSSFHYYQNLAAYVQFRTTYTSFFFDSIPRGTHTISYQLQAVIPGTFSALPSQIRAVYAPELRANSDEMIIKIQE